MFRQRQDSLQAGLAIVQTLCIAKAGAVAEFVRLLVEAGERVLLYGWHHEVYKLWGSAFDKAGIPFAMFTGEQSDTQKSAAAKRFIDGGARVLVHVDHIAAADAQSVADTVVAREI